MRLALHRQTSHTWSLIDGAGQFMATITFAPEADADKIPGIVQSMIARNNEYEPGGQHGAPLAFHIQAKTAPEALTMTRK
jgi:hypothetical protein